MEEFDVVLVIETDHCIAFGYEVDVYDVGKSSADVELADEFTVEAGEESQHCAFGAR